MFTSFTNQVVSPPVSPVQLIISLRLVTISLGRVIILLGLVIISLGLAIISKHPFQRGGHTRIEGSNPRIMHHVGVMNSVARAIFQNDVLLLPDRRGY